MGDQDIGEVTPPHPGEQPHKVLFDPVLIIGIRKPDPLRKALYVGVNRNALVLCKRMMEHDICGLAPDSGKFQETLDGGWDHPAKLADDHLRSAMMCRAFA